MKKNKITFQIIVFLTFTLQCMGQDIESALRSVEENNPYLVAKKDYYAARNHEYKTGLNPPDPSFSYGYFPGNSEAGGTKKTLEIMQSFDFPTVYVHQKRKVQNKIEQMLFLQESFRRDILLEAKKTLLNLVFLNKRGQELSFRKSMAEKLLSDFEKKLYRGTGTVVELNKARMELLNVKNVLKVNNTYKIREIEKLTQMNGGDPVDLEQLSYPVTGIINLDSLIARSTNRAGKLNALKSAKAAAQNEIKIQKSKVFPEFKIGYASELIAPVAFRGIKAGMTIPLWEDKNKIKTARAQADYTGSIMESTLSEFRSEIKQDYMIAETLKNNLFEYKTLLNKLNDYEVLKKSLNSGHISGIEYFNEVAYYYQMVDKYLETELEYHLVLARLNKYNL